MDVLCYYIDSGLADIEMGYIMGFEANRVLKSGEARDYSQAAFGRNKLLLESKGKDVVVSGYSVRPGILFWVDMGTDPSDWRNEAVSNFYNLNSVVTDGTIY